MKTFFSCLVVVAAFLLQSGNSAAQPPCRLTVPVIARAQKPIDPLGSGDFLAIVKRKEISIDAVEPPPSTRRFVFVLDRSGSMTRKSADLDRPVKQGLENAVSTVPRADTVAFVAFAGQHSQRSEFLRPDLAIGKIAEILAWKPEGKVRTPLWDNIHLAVQMLTPHKPGDVVVVISDGGDNSSKLHLNQIEDELTRSGITALSMITSVLTEGSEEKQGPARLTELAEATGGIAAAMYQQRPDFAPIGIWQERTNPVISQLAEQFFMDLEIPPSPKPEGWKLSIKSGETRKNVQLFYPRVLYPCAITK